MTNVRFTAGEANQSVRNPDQIKAEGDIRVQSIALHYIGIIVGILALGGIGFFFFCPDRARELWTIIAPIILAAVTGTLGFLAGEKSARRRG